MHGKRVNIQKIILEEYVNAYSLEMNFTKSTIKDKRGTLMRFLRFLGNKSLSLQNCRSYFHYLHTKSYKISSLRHEMRIIKATVNFLYKRKYIKNNFSSEIPMPKVRRKVLDIVPVEVAEKAILRGTEPGRGDNSRNVAIKREHRLALQFILRTGVRNSELRSLSGKDINIEEETFFVASKGGNIDVLPLPRDMIPEIRKRLNKSNLFKVTAETMNIGLKRGCKRLKINQALTVHTLRHIFCTTLLKSGVSLQVVSRLMRHSTVKITDSIYSHYNIEDLKITLNSKHPLLRLKLSSNELFDLLEKNVKETVGNKYFSTDTKRNSDELVIIVKCR